MYMCVCVCVCTNSNVHSAPSSLMKEAGKVSETWHFDSASHLTCYVSQIIYTKCMSLYVLPSTLPLISHRASHNP